MTSTVVVSNSKYRFLAGESSDSENDSDSNSALVTLSNSLPPPEDINLDSSDMIPVEDDLNLEDLMKQKVGVKRCNV